MATPRSSQAHQKRVQQIAEEAADKIAADSPLEEDVVILVEELPPGDSARSQRGRSIRPQKETANSMLGMVAQAQKLVAEGISRWIEVATAPFVAPLGTTETIGGSLDPRRLTEEGDRIAEALLISQKELALKVLDAMAAAKAA